MFRFYFFVAITILITTTAEALDEKEEQISDHIVRLRIPGAAVNKMEVPHRMVMGRVGPAKDKSIFEDSDCFCCSTCGLKTTLCVCGTTALCSLILYFVLPESLGILALASLFESAVVAVPVARSLGVREGLETMYNRFQGMSYVFEDEVSLGNAATVNKPVFVTDEFGKMGEPDKLDTEGCLKLIQSEFTNEGRNNFELIATLIEKNPQARDPIFMHFSVDDRIYYCRFETAWKKYIKSHNCNSIVSEQ